MATDLFIPMEVAKAIGKWIRHAEITAIADFPQTSKDEDTIVESFGSRIRCREKAVEVGSNVQERPGTWRWSISHTRFRGRGPGALEKKIGADVIVQMNVSVRNRAHLGSKSLLVQAKKNWTSDARLFEQAARLLTWREAASVINLTAKRFEAFNIDDVIAAKGKRPSSYELLSDYLLKEFVSGELGDETLRYDAHRESLQWLDMKGVLVRCSFPCKQRISIDVTAPDGPWTNPATITPEEIYDHRLNATPKQVLGAKNFSDLTEFKKAYRHRQKIYHPDKHSAAAPFVKKALKRESQEINRAFDELDSDN